VHLSVGPSVRPFGDPDMLHGAVLCPDVWTRDVLNLGVKPDKLISMVRGGGRGSKGDGPRCGLVFLASSVLSIHTCLGLGLHNVCECHTRLVLGDCGL